MRIHRQSLLMQMLKHVTCTCPHPLMANGLTISWALKDLRRTVFLFSWRQHKKGSSWMDAKSPWNFITKQLGTAEELREDSIYSSFNKLFYVFITPWLPHEKWAGETHAQEVTRKFFFRVQRGGRRHLNLCLCSKIFCNGGFLEKFCIAVK